MIIKLQLKRNNIMQENKQRQKVTYIYPYIILIVPRWHVRLRPEISIAPCPLLPSQVLSMSYLLFSFLPRLSSSKFLMGGLSFFFHYPVSTLMQFIDFHERKICKNASNFNFGCNGKNKLSILAFSRTSDSIMLPKTQ